MARLALLPLVLITVALGRPAAAQAPAAPGAAADSTIWSALEADALTNARRLLDGAAGPRPRPIRLPRGGLRLTGYRVLCFARGPSGEIVEARSAALADGLFLLAWPTEHTPTTSRGIALHADGTAMVCELSEDDFTDPLPEVITARGSGDKFTDVLRQPGTSATGHFWLWLQQVSKAASIMVFDENGEPRPGCRVALVGPDSLRNQRYDVAAPEGPWPVGEGDTDPAGKARLSGPLCNDLRVVVSPHADTMVTSGFSCEATADGLRIVLTTAALRKACVNRNESAAIATLKNISSAQAQCQASGAIDADRDGVGEYGYFAELAGVAVVRGDKTRKINPPVLSRAFADVAGSCAERGGYLFRIYLPSKRGVAVAEAENGGARGGDPAVDPAVDPDKAEVLWCCYAWPANADSGLRAFFVNQWGDVLACDNADADGNPVRHGRDRAVAPDSAFRPGDDGLANEVAANQQGNDGHRWIVVR